MAVNTEDAYDTTGRVDALPTFNLNFMIDAEHDPPEVILFPDSPESAIHSQWITSDLASAIPLEDIA